MYPHLMGLNVHADARTGNSTRLAKNAFDGTHLHGGKKGRLT